MGRKGSMKVAGVAENPVAAFRILMVRVEAVSVVVDLLVVAGKVHDVTLRPLRARRRRGKR